MKLYADDIKLYCLINSKHDSVLLDDNLNRIFQWGVEWQIKLNSSKRAVVHLGATNKNFNYLLDTVYDDTVVQVSDYECDLGVFVSPHSRYWLAII